MQEHQQCVAYSEGRKARQLCGAEWRWSSRWQDASGGEKHAGDECEEDGEALAGAIALVSADTRAQPPALRPSAVYVLSAHSVERIHPPMLPGHAQSLAATGWYSPQPTPPLSPRPLPASPYLTCLNLSQPCLSPCLILASILPQCLPQSCLPHLMVPPSKQGS